jgi:hypothetical protein
MPTNSPSPLETMTGERQLVVTAGRTVDGDPAPAGGGVRIAQVAATTMAPPARAVPR